MRCVAGCFRLLAAASTSLLIVACFSLPAGYRDTEAIADFRETQPQQAYAMHEFRLTDPNQQVVGRLQVTYSTYDDTFPDIARRFNLGYDELKLANPGVDPWLPGDGTVVYLPTQHVLPDAPREGLVLNLANMRLFYYPPVEPPQVPTVMTHPIGIGRVGWSTPLGSTQVIGKARNPTWYVPASIRREHAEEGDPLPPIVPPGPDNPLGKYALRLGMEGYLIHGTNKPYGVGMRVSHGCVRLYPEDIAGLYGDIPLDTPVHIVNQPVLAGWKNNVLYLETHAALEDDETPDVQRLTSVIEKASRQYPESRTRIDWARAGILMREPTGIAMPVSVNGYAPADILRSAHLVHNRLPDGATFDGLDDQIQEQEPEQEQEEQAVTTATDDREMDSAQVSSGAAPVPGIQPNP